MCEFPGSPSPERLRDQGLSKVMHIPDCLLSSVTPQTNTEGLFSPAFGAKSVHRRKGEAATVGLSLVCKGPPEHTDPASRPMCFIYAGGTSLYEVQSELRGGASSSDKL